VTQTRNPINGGRSDLAPLETRAHEAQPTRLAHWPPPFRSVNGKPRTQKQLHSDAPQRAHARGWRMTRAMFSEFEEDE
jgi:hypothetical protein